MIEETGRVVAVETGAVWVETVRQSACHACSAQSGCGHGALSKLTQKTAHVRALASQPWVVGDEVVIGIPESLVVTGSLLGYLLPLVCALALALLADYLTGNDAWTALAAALGLALGFGLVRWHFTRNRHNERYHPQVLRRARCGMICRGD